MNVEEMTARLEELENFAHWVASRVCEDDFDYESFAGSACRKLNVLGIVKDEGEFWSYTNPNYVEESEEVEEEIVPEHGTILNADGEEVIDPFAPPEIDPSLLVESELDIPEVEEGIEESVDVENYEEPAVDTLVSALEENLSTEVVENKSESLSNVVNDLRKISQECTNSETSEIIDFGEEE